MEEDGTAQSASLTDLFARLIKRGVEIKVAYITGHWLDVDNAADLTVAQNFL